MIQNIAAQVGDVDIGPAVVIVIAYRHPHPVGVTAQAGFFSHVSECAVVIVVIKTVPVARIRLVRLLAGRHGIFERRAIHEEKIKPTVAIVVQHSHAAAHGFRQILLRGQAGFILESDA